LFHGNALTLVAGMTNKDTRYRSFLLRLWRTNEDEAAVWRASLESPHTGKRKAFADLASLFAFLREQTDNSSAGIETAQSEEHDEG
jgi:hypothetical protein